MNNGHNKKTNSDSDNSAPQGIFSTPELTVDTEKIAPAQNSTDSKARVASFFANTDASKQAEQVQNAMTTPANYATEDLVINNGGKKKRSFLPIIIAVVVILAVVGGVTYFIIQNTTGNQSATRTLETAKQDFAKFATYALLGEADNNLTGNYDESQTYNLYNQFYDEDTNIEYWDTAEKYLDTAIDTYAALGESANVEQLALLEEYRKDFKFLAQYKINDDYLANEEIASKVLSSGVENTQEFIRNYYQAYDDLHTVLTQDFISQKISASMKYAELIELYSRAGCFANGILQEACVNMSDEDRESIEEILPEYNQHLYDAELSLQTLVQLTESQCWALFNNFDNSHGETE